MDPNVPRIESVEIDRKLEQQYVPFFQQSMGMPQEVAQEFFEALLKEVKEASLRDGTGNFPERFGELLLVQERRDQNIGDLFAPKRAEGVEDGDLVLWWNMHELERRMICRVDEMSRAILFEKLVQKDGLEQEDAARAVARRFPIFGDPEHMVFGTPEDRPLPYELKWRISRYMEERHATDGEQFKKEVEAASSLNALLRAAIRSGRC